jgi:predicted N-acetyltransferase YhbS
VALIICALDRSAHDRTAFQCGNPDLEDFLQTKAAKHQAQRISRTFVLVSEADPGRILGFYSLSNCQIDRQLLTETVGKTLPRHPISAVMLGRLAVDKREQGKRLGTWLLMDALKRTVLVGQQSGVFALVVAAADAKARDFYLRHGFLAMADRPLTLYLPLETGLRAMRAFRHDVTATASTASASGTE